LDNHDDRVFLKFIAKLESFPVCIEYLPSDGKALFERLVGIVGIVEMVCIFEIVAYFLSDLYTIFCYP